MMKHLPDTCKLCPCKTSGKIAGETYEWCVLNFCDNLDELADDISACMRLKLEQKKAMGAPGAKVITMPGGKTK